MVAHEHRFHTVAVLELPEVLDGAVLFGLLLAQDLGGVEGVLLRELLAKVLAEIGHLIVAAHALVEPGIDLLGPEGGLAQLLQSRLHLGQGHGFDVHIVLQITKP